MALNKNSEILINAVFVLLQQADELGGIESEKEYISLMKAVADEATKRMRACQINIRMRRGRESKALRKVEDENQKH